MKKLNQALSWKGIPLFHIWNRNELKPKSFNFIPEDFNDKEFLVSLGFDEDCVKMHNRFTWANIVSYIGVFSSVGSARKSGWDIPIESGYSEAILFKSDGTPIFVFIYNPVKQLSQATL